MALAPSGELAVTDQFMRVVMWNSARGTKVRVLRRRYGRQASSISPDGHWLAVVGTEPDRAAFCVLPLADARRGLTRAFEAESGDRAEAIAFVDGARLAYAGSQTVRLLRLTLAPL